MPLEGQKRDGTYVMYYAVYSTDLALGPAHSAWIGTWVNGDGFALHVVGALAHEREGS